MTLALIATLFALTPAQTPDYAALHARGVTFETFVENVSARRDAWRENVAAAAVPGELEARARALTHTWRVLVIAEDKCSDSAAALPYIAKLAAAAPDRLSLRIVDSRAGRAAMEAHRTPDGRAATPTVIFIRDDGEIRAWIERPAPLVAWIAEQKKGNARFDVLAGKTKWYADDAGRSTLAEIVALLEKEEAAAGNAPGSRKLLSASLNMRALENLLTPVAL
jgi:hypothetical protein